MAVDLMLGFPTLVQERQLKQRPHICALASQRNKNRHIQRIVLRILPVGVEVYSPLIPAHREAITGYVLPYPHPFRKRVSIDCKVV